MHVQAPGGASVPLNGSITFGEFFIGVSLHGQGAVYDVQVDTGSSDFAVVSSRVKAVPSLPHYNPWAAGVPLTSCAAPLSGCDPTSCPAQCKYALTYLDGSGFTAALFNDTVSFPGAAPSTMAVPVDVGAIVKQSKGFETAPIGGIVGVAFQTESEVNAPTFVDRLVATHGVRDSFAMCLDPGADTGTMVLGAPPSIAPFVFTPLIQRSFYVVNVSHMAVGGLPPLAVPAATYNSGQAIVDSGTTDFLIPNAAYSAMAAAMRSLCRTTNLVGVCGVKPKSSLLNGYCYSMTTAQRDAFPVLHVGFANGVSVDVHPNTYLTPQDAGSAYLCLNVVGGPESDGTILGDVVMRGYTTLFDRVGNQVGFAPRQPGVACNAQAIPTHPKLAPMRTFQ